jgi:hypothetical protein
MKNIRDILALSLTASLAVSIRKRSVSSMPSKPMRVERRTSKGLSRPP